MGRSHWDVLYNIARDLYLVLLFIFFLEFFPIFPWGDLLHESTRKGIITITVCVAATKLVQPFLETTIPAGAGPLGGPRTAKKTASGKSGSIDWASSEMQGWRPAMEDATCINTQLDQSLANQVLFAVFDGHGGSQVSAIAAREFPKVLNSCAAAVQKERLDAADGDASEQEPWQAEALHRTLMTLDTFLRQGGSADTTQSPAPSGLLAAKLAMEKSDVRNAFNLVGSTAIVALLECAEGSREPRRITVANCGDSRALLCRKGKLIELSEDHKPELPRESERIRKAGGHVAQVGPCHRIDGWGLNLSRALGDFHYKARTDLPADQQKVIALPEIQTLDITDDDEFLVLGCDGCFELNSSQEVITIVRDGFKRGLSIEKVVEELVDKSCSRNLMQTRGKGGDNCSAIVVKLR